MKTTPATVISSASVFGNKSNFFSSSSKLVLFLLILLGNNNNSIRNQTSGIVASAFSTATESFPSSQVDHLRYHRRYHHPSLFYYPHNKNNLSGRFPLYLRATLKMPLSATTTTNNCDTPLVVVVGSANQDLTSYTKKVPAIGETVLGQSFATSCGGKGANQAVAASNLNIVPVTMIGRVVDDVFGKALVNNFQKTGVNFPSSFILPASSSSSEPLSSGVASIIVDTISGDNMIIVTPGVNFALTPENVKESLVEIKKSHKAVAGDIVVLVQLEIPPESALMALRVGKEELGAITILNTAPAPDGSFTLEEFYPFVDILIPNQSELEIITKKLKGNTNTEQQQQEEAGEQKEKNMAELLFNQQQKCGGIHRGMVVTLGSRGAMVLERETTKVTMVNAPMLFETKGIATPKCLTDPVIDTVGAGDAFCGAFAVYLSVGYTITEASQRACAIASMSVRKRGAQKSYPIREELPDCLKETTKTTNEKKRKKPESSSSMTLTFVTGNKKKLEEIQRILLGSSTSLPFDITNERIDLPEYQGSDPVAIAKEKVILAWKELYHRRKSVVSEVGPVITEDTSLCFNAMNGMPGPYIKWFLDKCGLEGLNDMLVGFEDKSAFAQTVLSFCYYQDNDDGNPNKEEDIEQKLIVKTFVGRTDGTIVRPRGSLDFGWDLIFEPKECDKKTYAEMTKDEKNSISHRARSLTKLRTYLLNEYKP